MLVVGLDMFDWAHSPPRHVAGSAQPLEEHLRAVGQAASENLMAAFSHSPGLQAWAKTAGMAAGLAHDLGKATDAFQTYIKSQGRAPKAYHKLTGALLARINKSGQCACAIAAHHGGLQNYNDYKNELSRFEIELDNKAAETLLKCLKRIGLTTIQFPTPHELHQDPNTLDCEMYTRFLFSALIDADHTDTEAHFHPERATLRRLEIPLLPDQRLVRLLDAIHQKALQQADSPVKQARNEVLKQCLEAGLLPPGIFTLNVPTGGGKTLSSLAFALRHAAAHELRRVFMVVPYLSIIEQNANVVRNILGEAALLEHHSLAPWRLEEEDSQDPDHLTAKRRMASEDWRAPIIFTTAVQFLETLHASQTSRCRKLHRIARSVIIFDEVQTLPVPLLDATLATLKWLVEKAGVTLVLCTATQPALVQQGSRRGFSANSIRHIVDPKPLFQTLRRVHYEYTNQPVSAAQLAEQVTTHDRALIIVNTTKAAREVHQQLIQRAPHALHLSARMYPAHRLGVLNEVRQRLAANQPCLLVSTQVVEAGCDLDFPTVFREMGPLDSIAQAGGRCNREGKRSCEQSVVHVFHLQGATLPQGTYKLARDIAQIFFNRGDADLNDPEIYQRYFTKYYNRSDLDRKDLMAHRGVLNYKTVSTRYRLIEDGVTVLVPIGLGKKMRDLLQKQGFLSSKEWALLNRYSVNLFGSEETWKSVVAPVSIPDFKDRTTILEYLAPYHRQWGIQDHIGIDLIA